jgi:hypothetical protein
VATQRQSALSEERPQPNTDAEETLARRRQGNGGRRSTDQEEPDVLLDVPSLEVEKITLEVNNLRAHISVLAELANLLNLSVGADVRLDQVKLEIDGVRAQALLKVRLENVRAILEKALDNIAENPQILEGLAHTVNRTAEQVGGAARETLGEDGAVSQVAGGVGDATRRVGEAAGRVTEGAQGAVGQVASQGGQAPRLCRRKHGARSKPRPPRSAWPRGSGWTSRGWKTPALEDASSGMYGVWLRSRGEVC